MGYSVSKLFLESWVITLFCSLVNLVLCSFVIGMRGLRRSESAAFTSSRCWQRAMCSATRSMFVMLLLFSRTCLSVIMVMFLLFALWRALYASFLARCAVCNERFKAHTVYLQRYYNTLYPVHSTVILPESV